MNNTTNHTLTVAILLLFYAAVEILSVKSFYVLFPIFLYLVLRNGTSPIVKKSVLFFVIPSILAFAIGLFRFEPYDVFKDLTYFFIPISGLAFGNVFAKKYGAPTVLNSLETAGKIICLIFLSVVFIKFGPEIIYEARDIRDTEEGGLGIDTGFFPLVTAGIILYRFLFFRYEYHMRDIVWLFVCILAIIASGSRTYFISFIIVTLCIIISSFRRHFVRFMIITPLLMLAIAGIMSTNEAFVDSLKESTAEISIENTEDLNENENYRGYEAKMALLFVSESALEYQIAGNGAGVAVDMGNYAPVRRFVPITHNGYVYILLKFGLAGMAIILSFGIYILQYIVKWHPCKLRDKQLKSLSIGCILTLFAANYVICGIFNVLSYPLMIIIGCTLSYIYQDKKRCAKSR